MAWDSDDNQSDDEYSGFDTSGVDDDITLPCPSCGAEIFEDAEQCPECGRYVSPERAGSQRKPWWLVAGVVICLLIVLSWVVGAGALFW